MRLAWLPLLALPLTALTWSVDAGACSCAPSCDDVYEPVCGDDGQSYQNGCVAVSCAGVEVVACGLCSAGQGGGGGTGGASGGGGSGGGEIVVQSCTCFTTGATDDCNADAHCTGCEDFNGCPEEPPLNPSPPPTDAGTDTDSGCTMTTGSSNPSFGIGLLLGLVALGRRRRRP